jgi:NADH dehydrogenase [ubiquinone] 1 alpha subcomplex assembly factor 7
VSAVPDALRREIGANGPVTFDTFMEVALYGPDGFFERLPVGVGGDFVTSPHVHPVFGTLLWRAIRALWDELGRPTPLRVAEVGAGDGTLAAHLTTESDVALSYTAVERSPRARELLSSIAGIGARDDLVAPVDVVLCNELLDNLPFRRFRDDREIRIDLDGERLVEVLSPVDAAPPSSPSDGNERVAPVGAFAFLDRLAGSLERGYALLIDYGGLGTTGGPVHGYRDHSIVEDVLADPGATDITAGVDFDLIAGHAKERGLVAFPSVTQRDALVSLGIDAWLEEQLAVQRRRLEARDGREAVATWSGRSRATLLVDPGALGRLRWLLLATPGLVPPGWLTRAIERGGA